MCKTPVRKIKPSRIKANLIVKGNSNCQVRKLPGAIALNIVGLIDPGMTINGSLRDLATLRGYEN